MIGSVFFYIFAFLSIMGSLMVILPKNPVYSVLSLIFTFINVAALILLLNAEFLAMTLIIVYVGAIAVLFLFVVMMLDINVVSRKKNVFSLVGVIFTIFLLYIIMDSKRESMVKLVTFNITNKLSIIDSKMTNTHQIGSVLYTDYIIQFQLAGMVLLLAMIGCITLTYNKRVNKKLKIDPNESNTRNVEMVKVGFNQGIKDIDYGNN